MASRTKQRNKAVYIFLNKTIAILAVVLFYQTMTSPSLPVQFRL